MVNCWYRQGSRTVQNIKAAAKLPKRLVNKHNCSHPPLFEVIIDNLHQWPFDQLTAWWYSLSWWYWGYFSRPGSLSKLELLSECKYLFSSYVCKETKKLEWCDILGPEKHTLLGKINFPHFPSIPNVAKTQFIWTEEFWRLNSLLSSESFSPTDITRFAEDAKSRQSKFLQVYQTENITTYMRAFVAHIPEFLDSWYNSTINSARFREIERLTSFFYCGSRHTRF